MAVGKGVITYSLDTKSQKSQRIGTITNTTVSQHLNLVEDIRVVVVDIKCNLKRRRRAIQVATSVVGEDDGWNAVADSKSGILDILDTLEDNGKAGGVLVDVVHRPGVLDELGVGRGNIVPRSTLAVRATRRVHGPHDSLGTSSLGSLEQGQVLCCVGGEVDLGEEGLVGASSGRDGLVRQRRITRDLKKGGNVDQYSEGM